MTEIEKIHDNEEVHYKDSLEDMTQPLGLVDAMAELYLTFYRFVGTAPMARRIHTMARVHMAQECMYRLATGTLAVMRGHVYDSFRTTREAIEAAAFAIRMKHHPHLTRLWRKSGQSDASYQKYREAFGTKKLFPNNILVLFELGRRYDLCAKLSHPSFLASAPTFKMQQDGTGRRVVYPFFQGGASDPFARPQALLWMVDTHFHVIRALELALPEVVTGGGAAWLLHRNGMEGALTVHKGKFNQQVAAAKTPKAAAAGPIIFPHAVKRLLMR